VQERQLELQEKHYNFARDQWEASIMMKDDLNTCSEVAREYFINLQREILEKRFNRGGRSSSN
jgi:hypothetical protein